MNNYIEKLLQIFRYKASMIIDKIYDFLIVHFIEPLVKINNFPDIIQGIGLALLTILIPLAIAVLSDIYQKRKAEEKDFVYLDLHVILDNVFNIKLLILSVFLIFFPMFFWEIILGLDKLIAVHFTFIGILLIVDIIFKVSRWVKGNVFDFRFSYLGKLNRYKDLEIVWKSVWQVKNINIQNEQIFCKLFFSKIGHLLESPKNSLKITSKLLNDFYNFINERSITLLAELEITLPKILEWHFKIWQKKDTHFFKKEKAKELGSFSQISRMLDFILTNIEERSLKGVEAFSFFNHFTRHVENYKKEFIESGKKYYYISSLFNIFYRVFFKNIAKSSESDSIWENCFPKEWKITKNNLENKENIISKISLNQFLHWTQMRIWKLEKDFDRDLDEVSRNIFPDVEPILWSRILILIFSPYGDNRMKFVLERSWTFGFMGRFRTCSGDIEASKEESRRKTDEAMQLAEEAEVKNTFELAYLLFKENFSKENLDKYIKSLQELKYKENSEKEIKRLELINILNEMMKFLDSLKK